jgi:RHS repeat-associated protein
LNKSELLRCSFTTNSVRIPRQPIIGRSGCRFDPRGFAVTYTYDVLNRESRRLYPDSTTASTTYDPLSRKTRVAGAGGASTFVYDLAGRTTQYISASGVGYSYSYDSDANRTVMVEGGTQFTTYSYDSMGNLRSISNVQAGLSTYIYDSLNREQTRTSADGTVLQHTFDPAGRETARVATAVGTGGPLVSLTAAYDDVGNCAQVTGTVDGLSFSRNFAFDPANQLTYDIYNSGSYTSFVYDPSGNTMVGANNPLGSSSFFLTTTTYNPANAPLTSIESTSYNSPDSRSTTVTTYSYDLAGNRTVQNINGALTSYTWDYENRMVGVVQPGGTSVTNVYLANNRIVRAADAFGNLTTLTYDASGANLLRRDVGGASPATEHYTQPPKDFGGLLAQVSTANPSARFYLPDLSRNIGILGNGSTVSEVHLLQAFGLALPGFAVPTTQPYGFQGDAGAYTDPITGLPVMWNRVYDPNIGQFLNPDPIGLKGGDPNFRRFVWNNPGNRVDPTGLGPNLEFINKMASCIQCRLRKGLSFGITVFGHDISPPSQKDSIPKAACLQMVGFITQSCNDNPLDFFEKLGIRIDGIPPGWTLGPFTTDFGTGMCDCLNDTICDMQLSAKSVFSKCTNISDYTDCTNCCDTVAQTGYYASGYQVCFDSC